MAEQKTMAEELNISQNELNAAADEVQRLLRDNSVVSDMMHAIAGNDQTILIKIYQAYVLGYQRRKFKERKGSNGLPPGLAGVIQIVIGPDGPKIV